MYLFLTCIIYRYAIEIFCCTLDIFLGFRDILWSCYCTIHWKNWSACILKDLSSSTSHKKLITSVLTYGLSTKFSQEYLFMNCFLISNFMTSDMYLSIFNINRCVILSNKAKCFLASFFLVTTQKQPLFLNEWYINQLK